MSALDFSEILADTRAEIERSSGNAAALELLFFAACEAVARTVVTRYQFTTGPRLLQALEFPAQCPPDYPQAIAWQRGVAVLRELLAAIAARHGQLAAEACGDPVRQLAAIYRDGLTR